MQATGECLVLVDNVSPLWYPFTAKVQTWARLRGLKFFGQLALHEPSKNRCTRSRSG